MECAPKTASDGTRRRANEHLERAFVENNHVVLHCHQQWPGDSDYAGIDIFRFDEDGKIIEHWDVLQVVPESSKNANGMF